MSFQPKGIKINSIKNKSNPLEMLVAREFLQNQNKDTVGASVDDISKQFDSGIAPPGSSLSGNKPNIKLNPELPESVDSTLRLGRTQSTSLAKNANQLLGSKNLRSRLSPLNLSAHSGFLGNLSLQLEGLTNSKNVSEFAGFKSNTEQSFQQYRKYITGVQAGFPELQMLQPILPITTDPPSNYIQKAVQALDIMKTNEETILNYESKRGFKVDNLKGNFPADPNSIINSAKQSGLNVSPIPGSPGFPQQNQSSTDKKLSFLKRKGLA